MVCKQLAPRYFRVAAHESLVLAWRNPAGYCVNIRKRRWLIRATKSCDNSLLRNNGSRLTFRVHLPWPRFRHCFFFFALTWINKTFTLFTQWLCLGQMTWKSLFTSGAIGQWFSFCQPEKHVTLWSLNMLIIFSSTFYLFIELHVTLYPSVQQQAMLLGSVICHRWR